MSRRVRWLWRISIPAHVWADMEAWAADVLETSQFPSLPSLLELVTDCGDLCFSFNMNAIDNHISKIAPA